MFIQTSEINGFVLSPATLTAEQIVNLIGDDSTIVGGVGNDHKLNLMLKTELQNRLMRALITPTSAPAETELVGINANNSQVGIGIGQGLEIANGLLNLKAELIKDFDITNGSTNAIITGLDIKENEVYDIYFYGASTTGTGLRLQLGTKQNGYRYMQEFSYWYSSSGSVNVTSGGTVSDTSFNLGETWNYDNQYKINLVRIGNNYFIYSSGLGMDSATNYTRNCRGLVNTSSAIQSLTFSLTGSTFKSGGKILIFKRV
jgi:hypothetical protein